MFAVSFAELLAQPQVNIVWIATPTNEHAKQACQAIEAGKHVFCEKPLSISVGEVRCQALSESLCFEAEAGSHS